MLELKKLVKIKTSYMTSFGFNIIILNHIFKRLKKWISQKFFSMKNAQYAIMK